VISDRWSSSKAPSSIKSKMAPAADQSADDFDFGDIIDRSIFEQILEMDGDEDEGHEFSQSIVFDFFSQADATFAEMDHSLVSKDLQSLSDKGHFLKGSSATLGFTKVKDECEKIQNWGKKKDEPVWSTKRTKRNF